MLADTLHFADMALLWLGKFVSVSCFTSLYLSF